VPRGQLTALKLPEVSQPVVPDQRADAAKILILKVPAKIALSKLGVSISLPCTEQKSAS
jgi:hypothetical protein